MIGTMGREDVLRWLRETDPANLNDLWQMADEVRRANVGDEVHLRGLIEASNYCVRRCGYCGIRLENRAIDRYRMTESDVMNCASLAVTLGYGTVVIQAGEDYGLTRDGIATMVRRIKAETPLAVTLSLGERPDDDLVEWRAAGADRYLLRFETSDSELYDRIHPPRAGQQGDRFDILRRLLELGYEVGSGIMVGIPGQTWSTLANDLMMFREFDLDMIGIGPFIPHPQTPLGSTPEVAPVDAQVPADEETVLRCIALTRILCPEANIPSTTALATINRTSGREHGLQRGANIVMPNLTPPRYRVKYEIYPAKACIEETAEQCAMCLAGRIRAIGRTIGTGQGARHRRVHR
jgi:biotin synthase